MVEILSVEQGDHFSSVETMVALEVLKVWFHFNEDVSRWETSVLWKVQPQFGDPFQVNATAREFLETLKRDAFKRVIKPKETSSFNPPDIKNTATPTPPVTPAVDPVIRQLEEDFRRNAIKYGLAPSDLGRKVTLGGRHPGYFTIIGAKPRNWKLPILIRSKRGRIYKITAEKAKKGLV